jgi:hypothetical protein
MKKIYLKITTDGTIKVLAAKPYRGSNNCVWGIVKPSHFNRQQAYKLYQEIVKQCPDIAEK